ncbi:hypothetical protein [Paenibacillus kribbensis]|uniref:hypothetical protein n=1 Tax=Paenibacillus kribbensis TaxID=172713 RepID=UPI00351CEA45
MKESRHNPPNTYPEVISMNYTYKVLKSDIELFAVALSQVRVYVVQPLGEDLIDIVDYGGVVKKITSESIKINKKYFMRNQFEFRVDVKKGFRWHMDKVLLYTQ